MKKILLVAIIILVNNVTDGQQQSWNWNFGNNAGINFSAGSPVAFSGTAFNQMEGTASISDSLGNLLFYTDGITVYNSQNVVMPNGTGLMGNNSSTQSAIIAKQPGSSSMYFIFTVDYNHDGFGIGNGFRYTNVDMTMNGGMGAVTNKNILVRLPVYEKLIAVCDENGIDYWIVIHDFTSDDIFSYHLTSAGLDTIPVMSSAGPINYSNIQWTTGYMKASSQGDKLVLAFWAKRSYELLQYDNATGIASNHITIHSNDMDWTYGAEFSPDGTKLYGTKLNSPCRLYQFDITSWDSVTILNSRVQIGTNNSSYYYCALQLGPDGKIYCALSGQSTLGVINSPNVLGTACNYVNNGVNLGGGSCRYGLPTFVPCYVIPTGLNTLENETETNIFPNPASTLLNISINDRIKDGSFKIFDVAGKLLITSQITSKNFQIDIDQIKSGIYFLQLKNNERIINRKIFIEK